MGIRSVLSPVLGFAFGITILLTSIFGNYIITLLLPLVYFGRHLQWRAHMDRAISFWMFIPISFLEFIFGVRVRVSGDIIDPDQPAIVIMNHRTRLDWMYYWSALYQQNPWLITTSKISLKSQLKSLPGAGFGMAAAQFIFLERNLDADKRAFDEAIDYYTGVARNYQVLLFPEGTDKSEWTTKKSASYAAAAGLRPLRHLLHPRHAGFQHLLARMRRANYISHIYDVTIAYPRTLVQSEVELTLKGRAPSEVHFHVEKIPIESIPKETDAVSEWMTKLWYEKDERLARFYGEPKSSDRLFPTTAGQHVWRSQQESRTHRAVKLASFCFWLSVTATWFFHLSFIGALWIGVIYSFLTSMFLAYRHGGIDKFVYSRWKASVKTAIV